MKSPIVILHGWGINGTKYDRVKKILINSGYKVFNPDLPGFGSNSLKKEELDFQDYVDFVSDYISDLVKKLRVKNVILIGHSFGGRIAIRVTNLHPNLVAKLILTGASGIPSKMSIKKRIISISAGILKPVFQIKPLSFFNDFSRKAVYHVLGEFDYYKSGNLSKTFKNVYKVSIVSDLNGIRVPTYIVWGEKDKFTPIEDGIFINKKIVNSKLDIISNATHKLPYESPEVFANYVLKYLN